MTKVLTLVQLFLCVVTIGCIGQSTSSSDTVLEKGESRADAFLYPGGQLKRVDFLTPGDQLLRSKWFLPDGRRFAESRFVDGAGLDLHLHDNGAIKHIVPIQHGVANGTVYNFNPDGSFSSSKIYVDGRTSNQE
jgi:antitoxin component YwqK of YwqJK toxin-antitoxin module